MLQVGILLDALVVPVWINDCIKDLQKRPDISIDFVVLNLTSKKRIIPYKKVGYRILKKTDQLIYDRRRLHSRKELVEVDVPIIESVPISKGFSDWISNEDLNKIASFKPDLLLRFGFRILKGEILTLPKYGVLSFHHGNMDNRRGGPPGFWEVVNGESVSTISLQILSNELDGGKVVAISTVKCNGHSFIQTEKRLYTEGLRLFKHVFEKASRVGFDAYFKSKNEGKALVYSHPIYKAPGNCRSVFLLLKYCIQLVKSKFRSTCFKDQWQIFYKIRKDGQRGTRLYKFKSLVPPKNKFWADPFVIIKDNTYYLFFEEAVDHKKNAHISCLQFSKEGKLLDESPAIVLSEKFHLSYPFVFSHEGDYWMIPESAENKQVVLYKALDFPFRWEKHHVMLDNIHLYDATIHSHEDGYWYLMGTVKHNQQESADMYLHIYYTSDLFAERWMPHPKNPIYKDVRLARPAGKLFYWEGKLIRPSQVCAPIYGKSVKFNHIEKLSTTEFKETTIVEQTPDWDKKMKGTHIYNYDEGFTCIDVLVKRSRWF